MTTLAYSGSATGTGSVTLVTPPTNSNQQLVFPDNSGTFVSTGSLGAVTPAMTQVGALPSMVRLNTDNGYGSTNNKIRRFTNIVTNQGSDITYADSVTLGATFTINTNGVYAVTVSDCMSNAYVGLSLNTTQPTVAIQLLTNLSEQLGAAYTGGTGVSSSISWTGYLASGSVIRSHNDGTATSAAAVQNFTIVRVA
jgi:hypothetical protein